MRALIVVLAIALSVQASTPVVTAFAQTEVASVAGVARSSNGQILGNVTVQLRDLETGRVAGTATTSSTGSFSFAAVGSGNYVIEILNAAGQVVGTSQPISVSAGAALTGVSVAATAAAVAARTGGIAGLSTIAAITSAAAAAGVVGVVNRRNGDASPSR
jgi:hypothetical protein